MGGLYQPCVWYGFEIKKYDGGYCIDPYDRNIKIKQDTMKELLSKLEVEVIGFNTRLIGVDAIDHEYVGEGVFLSDRILEASELPEDKLDIINSFSKEYGVRPNHLFFSE